MDNEQLELSSKAANLIYQKHYNPLTRLLETGHQAAQAKGWARP
jgi:UDP-N-acetylglucosamine transferase subunit ALG13